MPAKPLRPFPLPNTTLANAVHTAPGEASPACPGHTTDGLNSCLPPPKAAPNEPVADFDYFSVFPYCYLY